MEYWADHPPAHVLLAARYGLEPKRKKKGTAAEEAEDLAIAFGSQPERPPDYIAEALEWAEGFKKDKLDWN